MAPWLLCLGQTYLDPWRDKTRAKLLIAATIGTFGAGLMAMYLNYSIAGLGIGAAALYHGVRMLLLGGVMVALTFRVLSLRFGSFLIALLAFCGVVLLYAGKGQPLWMAAGFALVSGPFWALFSQRYALQQSRENHGNETALLLYVMTLSAAAGLFVAGPLLEIGGHETAMLLGGGLMLVGTLIYCKRMPYNEEWKRAFGLVHWRKPVTLLTFFYAMQGVSLDFGLATWMKLVGITPLSAVTSLALRPVLGLFLTPVVGHIIQRGRINLAFVGGGFLVAGWVLLLPSVDYPYLLLPALTMMTIGNNLIGPSEVSRWYKRRSSAAIVAREFVLMSGRMPAIALTVPVVFFLPLAYPFVGLGIGALFTYGVRLYSKKIRKG